MKQKSEMSPALVPIFVGALLANAFLLFLVQPMFTKTLLPLLGGAPAVWTACMLFFQAALLGGYAYAHVTRTLPLLWQAALHTAVLAVPLIVLPLEFPAWIGFSPAHHPVAWLISGMTISMGLPFFVLSTTAPLLQRWFASTRHGSAADPYFLYAASNAGSLAGLLAYPVVIEPALTLQRQAHLWAAGYVLGAVLVTICATVAVRHHVAPADPEPARTERIGPARRLHWMALSFTPASLMLAVTTYLSTDVAAFPLLWIVPLALYLLTFVVAFGRHGERAAATVARRLPIVLLPLVLFMVTKGGAPLWFILPVHLVTFAGLSLLCHGQLAKDRPPTAQLTAFYLAVAAGGVLAGVFNAVVAPRLFTDVSEYPLVIGAACLIQAPARRLREVLTTPRLIVRPVLAALLAVAALAIARALRLDPGQTLSILGISALVAFGTKRDPARFAVSVVLLLLAGASMPNAAWGRVVHTERTFFGVYRVSLDERGRFISLFHGTTLHGRQVLGDRNPEAKTYFHPRSPIGQVLAPQAWQENLAVGVVGLGVGSLAAYAKPGQTWTFYEIDPAVERIARNTQYFHYLDRCGQSCRVVLGDARISLAKETRRFDVLVLDAFSSDAIPMHLLTTEATATYLDHLQPDGLIALHISNRHVALRPVVARLARDHGLVAFGRVEPVSKSDEAEHGYSTSEWVVMGRSLPAVEAVASPPQWVRLMPDVTRAWSDDFSNIWTALMWR
jgi:spermidine synthase